MQERYELASTLNQGEKQIMMLGLIPGKEMLIALSSQILKK